MPDNRLQVPFPGSLHVTSRRLCFAFEDRGLAPIKLPGKAIKGAAKVAADAVQGACSWVGHLRWNEVSRRRRGALHAALIQADMRACAAACSACILVAL